MTCVAIAMVASFLGIFFTSFISWNGKNATTKVEANRNEFYSWLQTELLPVLTGNITNVLGMMNQNLVEFNRTFRQNIRDFGDELSQISSVSEGQREIVQTLNDLDIQKMTQANLQVLMQTQGLLEHLEVFNGHLSEVGNRLVDMSHSATYLDNTLGMSFEEVRESLRRMVGELRASSIQQFDELRRTNEEQLNQFNQTLQQQREAMIAQNKNNIDMLEEIRAFAESKDNLIQQLVAESKKQTEILNKPDSKDTAIKQLVAESEKQTKILDELGKMAKALGPGNVKTPAPSGGLTKSDKALIGLYVFIVVIGIILLSLYSK